MDQCIFLAEDGKRCTIYEVRPVQCRTYPYWTHLISSKERWVGEAVVPVDVPGKHWSPEEGGCEGINHVDAPTINPNTIFRNYELYEQYNDKFPFMATGDDEKRLLAKAGAIEV